MQDNDFVVVIEPGFYYYSIGLVILQNIQHSSLIYRSTFFQQMNHAKT